MSYSRWGGSVWYTFWASYSKIDPIERNKQIFEICTVRAFTYKELKEDIDKCIELTKEAMIESEKRGDMFSHDIKSYSEEQFEELKGYMRQFIKDVEDEQGLK